MADGFCFRAGYTPYRGGGRWRCELLPHAMAARLPPQELRQTGCLGYARALRPDARSYLDPTVRRANRHQSRQLAPAQRRRIDNAIPNRFLTRELRPSGNGAWMDTQGWLSTSFSPRGSQLSPRQNLVGKQLIHTNIRERIV